MRHLLLAGMVMVGLAAAAHADGCANAADQRTLDECADKAYRRSDAELNQLYGQIVRRLKGDPATTKLLTAAQRAWVAFRDAECSFAVSGASTGSIYPMLYAECAHGLTTARVSDFKKYLSCQEGDMACPVPPP